MLGTYWLKVSLHEQMHKKQKTIPSDISSEPPNKQSAETVQPPHPRSQRVAARRQKELLCTFQFQELEGMELDDVDTDVDVFSINKGGGGILLTLRTVTRREGGPHFRQNSVTQCLNDPLWQGESSSHVRRIRFFIYIIYFRLFKWSHPRVTINNHVLM